MPIKRIVKRGLEHVAARMVTHRSKSNIKRLLILMYHRVLPKNDERMNDEEPGMVVTPGTLSLHLDILRQHFDIMHLSTWMERRSKGLTLPQRACAITFDDGWLDNYQYAFPLLQQHQVPATIFLVSEMVGTSRNFWPERLAKILRVTATQHPELWNTPAYRWLRDLHTTYSFGQQPPNYQQRFEIIDQAKHFADEALHARIDAMHNKISGFAVPEAAILNWDQIAEMNSSGLMEFGSHTCDHIRLNDKANQQSIEHQITASKKTIENATNKPVELFCYPNGDFNEVALSITRQHYSGAVTTAQGWNNVQTDAHLLNRIGVHEDVSADETAFLARLSGWL